MHITLTFYEKVSMKTSARNQFTGKVSSIKTGSVNDEIELDVGNGHKIVATVTRESTESLGLKVGSEAIALIKASSIILITDDQGMKFSARNRLAGKVAKVTPGAVNSEVVIELPGGMSIAAIVTNESVTTLGLKSGASASAMFKVSNVIVGVRT